MMASSELEGSYIYTYMWLTFAPCLQMALSLFGIYCIYLYGSPVTNSSTFSITVMNLNPHAPPCTAVHMGLGLRPKSILEACSVTTCSMSNDSYL